MLLFLEGKTEGETEAEIKRRESERFAEDWEKALREDERREVAKILAAKQPPPSPPEANQGSQNLVRTEIDAQKEQEAFYKRMLKGTKYPFEKTEVSAGSAMIFWLVCAPILFIDIYSGFQYPTTMRFVGYLFLTFVVTMLLWSSAKNKEKFLGMMIGLFLFSLGLPLLFGFFQTQLGVSSLALSILMTLSLPFSWVALFESQPIFSRGFRNFIFVIFLVMLFIILMPFVSNAFASTQLPQIFDAYRPTVSFSAGWDAIKTSYGEMVKNIRQSYINTVETASGGYYNGVVEQTSKEPLGIYLNNFKTSNAEVLVNSPLAIKGTLSARNFENEDAIAINLDCYAKIKDQPVSGNIQPDNVADAGDEHTDFDLMVSKRDQKIVLCEFPEGITEQGSGTVTISAEFNFVTKSYVKMSFINTHLLDSYRNLNDAEYLSRLSGIGITDLNPQSVSSKGPIQLNMGAGVDPLAISPEEETKFISGITIDNMGEGNVKEVRKVLLYLPLGIHPDESCTKYEPYDGDDPDDALKNENGINGYEGYQLTQDEIKKLQFDVEKYITIDCPLIVEAGEYETIMENKAAKTTFMRAIVYYEYKLTQDIPINVKTPKGFFLQLTPSNPTAKDEIHCRLSHSQFPIDEASLQMQMTIDEEPTANSHYNCDNGKRSCEEIIPIQKRGSTIGCTVHAKANRDVVTTEFEKVIGVTDDVSEYYEFTGSVKKTIENAIPEIKTIKIKDAEEGKDVTCSITVEDADNDAFGVWYRFGGTDMIQNFKPCNPSCDVVLPVDYVTPGQSYTCIAIPDDLSSYPNHQGKQKVASITIKSKQVKQTP